MQFLHYDNEFHLNRNNPIKAHSTLNTPIPHYFPNKLTSKQETTCPKQICESYMLSSKSALSVHDNIQTSSLQTLMQHEDESSTPVSKVMQRFKNVRYSSKNKIFQKITALKTRLPELKRDEAASCPALDMKKNRHIAEILVHSIMHTKFDINKHTNNIRMADMTQHSIAGKTGMSVSEPYLDTSTPFFSVVNSSKDSLSSCEDVAFGLPEETSVNCDTVSNIVKNLETLSTSAGGDEVYCYILESPNLTLEQSQTVLFNTHKVDKDVKQFPLAPLAKFEDFEDESDVIDLVKPNKILHSIIPPIPLNMLNLTESTLTKTAMHTMLLERVNIMGTYTPPSSPSSTNIKDTMFKLPNCKISQSFLHPATTFVTNTDTITPIYLNAVNEPVETLAQGSNNMHASLIHSLRDLRSAAAEPTRSHGDYQRSESVSGKLSHSPLKSNSIGILHRRSSDSDLSITPKGSSLTGSDKSYGHISSVFTSWIGALTKTGMRQDNFDMLDYPFITMTKFPVGFVINFGGAVSARSVKRLDRLASSDEPESRDLWWNELRMEIRAHARSLNCNAVLAYVEHATLCEGICVLSASGTAAVVGDISECSCNSPELLKNPPEELQKDKFSNTNPLLESPLSSPSIHSPSSCSVCHLPYAGTSSAFQSTTINKCTMCRSGKVSDVIISNTEIPDGIPTTGCGCLIQAFISRPMKDSRNEPSAKEVSDCLPFLEYDLHRILMNKIKIKGMNALFGLKVKISIGAKMLVGIATGTGVFLLPLHPLSPPLLVANQPDSDNSIADMQKLLSDTIKSNREIYQLNPVDDTYFQQLSPDQEVFEDDMYTIDPTFENRDCSALEIGAVFNLKDSKPSDQLKERLNTSISAQRDACNECIHPDTAIGRFGIVQDGHLQEYKSDNLQFWEVDDPEDMEIMKLLVEPHPPDGFYVVNIESVPGLEEIDTIKFLQMFTHICRVKVQHPYNLSKLINKLFQGVYFKLRRMIPCALNNLQFYIELPETDEIQISVIGMVLGFSTTPQIMKSKDKSYENEEEAIFILEDDVYESVSNAALHIPQLNSRAKSPSKTRTSLKYNIEGYSWRGVDITSMSYVPAGRVDRYLGNLNLFFIRESTSIREEGGLNGFMHRFLIEVLAILRSHIIALGGNAMVAYYMTQCVISHSIHKNQGQCLINVGGDVVAVSYFNEE